MVHENARLGHLLLLCAALTASVATAQSAARATLVTALEPNAFDIARSRTGLVYYTAGHDDRMFDELRTYDPVTGKSFHVDSGGFADLVISPKGDRLAFVRSDSVGNTVWTIRLNPRTGKTEGLARRLSIRYGRAPTFSPDGRFIAFTTLPPTDTLVVPRIVRVPVAGGPEQVIVREAGWAFPIFWSADGKWIYYHHGTPRAHTLRRVPVGGGTSEVLGPTGNMLAISPNDRWIAHSLPFSQGQVERTLVISDKGGREVDRFALPAGVVRILWATGTQLMAVRRQGLHAVHFADLNERIAELIPPTPIVPSIDVTPDGREVRVRTGTDPRNQLAVIDLLTRKVRTVSGDSAAALSMRGFNTVHAKPAANRRTQPTSGSAKTPPTSGCDSLRVEASRHQFSTTLHACRREDLLELRLLSRDGQIMSVRRAAVVRNDPLTLRRADDTTVVAASAYQVLSIPLRAGEPRMLYAPTGTDRILPLTLSISTDSRWVAITSLSSSISTTTSLHLIPLQAGAPRTLTLPTDPLGTTYWDPGQRYIAFVGDYKSSWHVWLQPLNGDQAFPLTGAEPSGMPNGTCCTWAPDGSGVMYTLERGLSTSLWTIDLVPLLSKHVEGKR